MAEARLEIKGAARVTAKPCRKKRGFFSGILPSMR
jgi:hypothetical protein